MCTAKSHALSPHTSRDAPCGVCLGVWRVVFGQVGAWSTTLPWHLSNVPDVASGRMHAGEMCTCQVARTLTTHESRCTLWRVFGSMACCFLAKLVLGPPHTTMTPFKRARRGEWAYACWRDVHVPHV